MSLARTVTKVLTTPNLLLYGFFILDFNYHFHIILKTIFKLIMRFSRLPLELSFSSFLFYIVKVSFLVMKSTRY